MKTNIDAILKIFDKVVEILKESDVMSVSELRRRVGVNSVKLSKVLSFLIAYDVVSVRLYGRYMIISLHNEWEKNYERFKKEFVEKGQYFFFYEK